MDEKDLTKFLVKPLTTENYNVWLNDIDVIHSTWQGLWKFFEQTDGKNNEQVKKAEIQRKDLAFAYILTSINAPYKTLVRRLRCPTEVWGVLKETFLNVSVASIDAK